MKNKKNKGLTLIEMIITVTILVVVVSIVGSVTLQMFQNFMNFNSTTERHTHEANLRLALLGIVRDARASDEFEGQDPITGEVTFSATSNNGNPVNIIYVLSGREYDSSIGDYIRVLTRRVVCQINDTAYADWHIGFAAARLLCHAPDGRSAEFDVELEDTSSVPWREAIYIRINISTGMFYIDNTRVDPYERDGRIQTSVSINRLPA